MKPTDKKARITDIEVMMSSTNWRNDDYLVMQILLLSDNIF